MSNTLPSESKYFVFLLGAGFSAFLGPPVMKNFMGEARRMYHKLKVDNPTADLTGHYEKMLQFQQKCLRSSGWIFNRDWENIEEVYTQADLLRLVEKPDKKAAQCLCEDIAWSIWDVYRKSNEKATGGMGQEFGRLLQMLYQAVEQENLRPVIITTNYDLIIEKLIALWIPKDFGGAGNTNVPKWSYYYPGFELPSNPDQALLKPRNEEPNLKEKIVPVIKLHGSANWFSLKKQELETAEDIWVATTATGMSIGRMTSVDAPELQKNKLRDEITTSLPEFRQRFISPAIIPPMLGKASVMPTIASQWRTAMEFLRGARKLWIVGYSFPATDTFMPRLLCEGLQDNQDLQEFVIVNIDSSMQWKERIERLLTPSITQTKVGYMQLRNPYNSHSLQEVVVNAQPPLLQRGGIEWSLTGAPKGGFYTYQV